MPADVHKITPAGEVESFAAHAQESFLYIAVTDDAGHPLALPPATLLGDYDRDRVVDAADYVVWRTGLGTTHTQSDYDVCVPASGHTAGGGAGAGATSANAAVPEPSGMGLLLAAVGLLGLVIFVQRRETLVATFLLGALSDRRKCDHKLCDTVHNAGRRSRGTDGQHAGDRHFR